MEPFRPTARRIGLLTEELPDELLVYDTERHQVHCLNRTAAHIWRHCDGATTTAELAERAATALELPITEEVVWHALDQFAEFHLLEAEDIARAARAYVTRREAIAELSGIVGLALPLVVSITTPVAAQTGSLGPSFPPGPSGPSGPSGPPGLF